MHNTILAIDAGTTSVRAIIFSASGAVLGAGSMPCAMSYPQPGHVEQNGLDIWQGTKAAIEQALKQSGLGPSQLDAIGITGQRTSVMIWERSTGMPLSPMVSWQDVRGAARADELTAKGFMVAAPTAAAKLEQIIDSVDEGRARMKRGELCWGNVDSYLAFCLTGGTKHITDMSQACATCYYDFFAHGWLQDLIDHQNLSLSMFPSQTDSWGDLGMTSAEVFGAQVPLCAILGDQQAAMIAQGAKAAGDVSISYGTSAAINIHTGSELMLVEGTYPLVTYHHEGETAYCIEGLVYTAGAMFDWLTNSLELAPDLEALSQTVDKTPSSAGVYVLPALQGLGSPHNDPTRHGQISGLTRGTTKAHIMRATMEGLACRIREATDACYIAAPNLTKPDSLRVDGGASNNDVLMQIQADIFGTPIERLAIRDAAALGVAISAGTALGMWDKSGADHMRKIDKTFTPQWSQDQREEFFSNWKQAFYL
ncbi:MAG: FGGY family carbohydrate kinase [Parvibaculaceae bacterium]|nr:FGGY family carbohydrate kinase [Parvibaculaceae bacterium]